MLGSALLTRQIDDNDQLAAYVRAAGFSVHLMPLLAISAVADEPAVRQQLASLSTEALVFTSRNGVEFSADLWPQQQRQWHDFMVYAVGPGTANAISQRSQVAVRQPPAGQSDASGLAALMLRDGIQHAALLQADNARPVLRDALFVGGCEVTAITVYRAQSLTPTLPCALAEIDVIPCTSSANVRRLLACLSPDEHAQLRAGRPRLVAIGRQTAATLRDQGFPVAKQAREPTVAALAQAMRAAMSETNDNDHEHQ